MASSIEFYFDYGSPFSYLADTQLPALASRTGAAIIYKPILLGAIFKETGNASPVSIPAKGRYMGVELARWSRHYGVPFSLNPNFPINTTRLMRGAIAAQKNGSFESYHRAIFPAFWARGLNLGDASVMQEVIAGAGLDAERILAATDEPAIKDQLRANTEEAVKRGAFGAPTFFVGDEMFWGNDRLKWVEEALV